MVRVVEVPAVPVVVAAPIVSIFVNRYKAAALYEYVVDASDPNTTWPS